MAYATGSVVFEGFQVSVGVNARVDITRVPAHEDGPDFECVILGVVEVGTGRVVDVRAFECDLSEEQYIELAYALRDNAREAQADERAQSESFTLESVFGD